MAEKTFKDYLLTAKKEYKFRLKFAVDITQDDRMKKIERYLRRYDVLDMSAPKRIPFQKNPLDFKNGVENVDVHYVDVVLKYPASIATIQMGLHSALDIAEKFVVVVDLVAGDPYGEETKRILDIETNKNQPSKLSDSSYETDPKWKNVSQEDYVGDAYNQKMAKSLSSNK